ncbi:MAG: alcohol dehydrogenase, partial [Actinobacteria bacterium]|nr:alcohol dehydrogenase [Actinomycetota bacterium]
MQAVKSTEDGVRVVAVDDPDPTGDEVVVEMRSASVCGSDLHLAGFGPLPAVMGHEFAGILADGTPVAVDPNAPCGACDLCTEGKTHLCRNLAILGVTRDGGMAERVRVHPSQLVRLPAGVAPEQACLVEPLAVAVHGMGLAGVGGGSRLAVVGAGSIGLAAVAAATGA